MFAQQSRAQFAPMNVPPGSPRRAGGGMGKGGGGPVSTPGGGGKGGGGQPMRGRPFDNNPGGFGGPRGFGGGPAPIGGGDPVPEFQSLIQKYPAGTTINDITGGGPRPAGPIQAVAQPSQPPVLNEYGLPAAVQPPALNQYGLPMGMHPSQMPANPGPRPMGPSPSFNPGFNSFPGQLQNLPGQIQGGNMQAGLMQLLQGFGGF